MLQIIISHQDKGVFLGQRCGTDTFSKIDGFRFNSKLAPAFKSEEAARSFVQVMMIENPDDYDYSLVQTAERGYATIAEIREFGFGADLGSDMMRVLALAAA